MVKDRPKNLKELVIQGYAFPSLRPDGMTDMLSSTGHGYKDMVLKSMGDVELDADHYRKVSSRSELLEVSRLDDLEKYVGFFVKDDYAGKSPAMFTSLFKKLNLPYGAFMFVADPNDADIIFEALRNDEKFIGGGLGVGFKERYGALDGVSPEGIMSVNNLVRHTGSGYQRIIGYNTDASGFVSGLQKKLGEAGRESIKGRTIVVLGAGAIAGDIVMELGSRGAKGVSVLNRTVSKADSIKERVNSRYPGLVVSGGEDEIGNYLLSGDKIDAIVNVSVKGGDGPMKDYSAFAVADVDSGTSKNHGSSRKIMRDLANRDPSVVVADVQQRDTITLQLAREAGLAHLLNGNDMVIRQGVDAVTNMIGENPHVFGDSIRPDDVFDVFSGAVYNEK